MVERSWHDYRVSSPKLPVRIVLEQVSAGLDLAVLGCRLAYLEGLHPVSDTPADSHRRNGGDRRHSERRRKSD